MAPASVDRAADHDQVAERGRLRLDRVQAEVHAQVLPVDLEQPESEQPVEEAGALCRAAERHRRPASLFFYLVV